VSVYYSVLVYIVFIDCFIGEVILVYTDVTE